MRRCFSIAAALLCAVLASCSEQSAPPQTVKTTTAEPKAGAEQAAATACGLSAIDYEFRGLKDRFLTGASKPDDVKREAVFARRVIHVNTDGAPNSYHSRVIAADDRQVGALNLICNAVVSIYPQGWFDWWSRPRPVRCYGERGIKVDPAYAALYEKIRANDWRPADGHRIAFNWNILGKQPSSSGWIGRWFEHPKPCVDANGFFTSMTKLKNGPGKDSCDQSAYIDAREVPAFVLPQHWFADWKGTAVARWGSFKDGDVTVAYRPAIAGQPERWIYGVVGDSGPLGRLGEASVAFNWALKGEQGRIDEKVRSYLDVLKLDSGSMTPKEVPFLVLEGSGGALGGNYSADNVRAVAQRSFESWGGPNRFKACLGVL